MHYKTNKTERGASLLEFAIAATVFLTVIFGVLECGRFLWTHNALKDAARRGARYARFAGRMPPGSWLSKDGCVRRSECDQRNPNREWVDDE